MDYKKDFKKFMAEDVTQTFGATAGILIILLLTNLISEKVFGNLFLANIVGFYGDKVTNFNIMKR